MMRIMRWSFLLVALVAFGCSNATSSGEKSPPRPLSKDEGTVVQADNVFGLELFRRMSSAESDSNLFISPLSVSMALGMALNGANGATRDSMAQVLALNGLTEEQINASYRSLIDLLGSLDPKVTFRIANSVWSRKDLAIQPAFSDALNHYFSAQVTPLDFSSPQASSTINQWVSDATSGRIPSIVPERVPDEMVMYLINAIYFKGTWTVPFDKDLTGNRSFTLASGEVKQVPMMRSAEQEMLTASDDRFQMIDLPYGDGSYSMTVLLPRPEHSVKELISGLDQSTWNEWIGRLHSSEAMLVMPKFTLAYEASLNEILKGMGMSNAFKVGIADFSRISGAPGDLFISEVKHKTFVEVNEEGTEAAAVTSVGIGTTAAPLPIEVNRPFLFAIREHHSGTILFIGTIFDPMP